MAIRALLKIISILIPTKINDLFAKRSAMHNKLQIVTNEFKNMEIFISNQNASIIAHTTAVRSAIIWNDSIIHKNCAIVSYFL